jgi:multidrug resistance efflux pump
VDEVVPSRKDHETYNEAKANFDRNKTLFDKGIISKSDWDKAVSAFESAKANKQSAYFETAQFGRVFEFLQAHPKISNLKEVKNTLRLGIEHVSTLDIAIELLQELVLEPVKN